jgi:tRNA dimethylallyltransferase
VAESLVLAIFGPTASGKSAVAEAIAERIPAEVVSADAMQVYCGLPILTNQPAYQTRLVAVWDLDHEASVGEYQPLAHAAVDGLLAAGKTPVVVGGTGLYLRAALSGLALPPQPAVGARQRAERLYDRLGSDRALAVLAENDPAAAARVHPNDRRRVVRALELAEAGVSLAPAHDTLWTDQTRHPTIVFGLEIPREVLERRIEERARAMFERGAAEEACLALTGPISTTARYVLGLREAADLPREQAIEAIAQRTRRYAAYQRKWMRRIPGLVSVPGARSPGETADEIVEVARTRQRLPAGRAG